MLDPVAFGEERRLQSQRFSGAHPTVLSFMAAKRIADDGGIAWPPNLDYIVGVEVKCAYQQDGIIKADKKSPDR